MKIGFGFDAHVLVEGKALKLGGVLIPHPKGLHGHSDGDVVLHALSDAILGACARGDIGVHFPDIDASTTGIDSREILAFCLKTALESDLRVSNIDIVLIADEPKMNPHYESVRESIAEQCNVPPNVVSVKSKTTEGTLVGRTAIACIAVVLMDEL
ncbi:MAG TPA: 2-C-methyl-D-erythritol 2,4-cyclodiphosphate synthase [Candidatus Kryptonia bacterium]